MYDTESHIRQHVRETGRPATTGTRAARLAAAAILAAVAVLGAGCANSSTAVGGDASDPPSNNTAAAKYGFVDTCAETDAGAWSQLIDDPEPPKIGTDVDNKKTGFSSCSWSLVSTVLTVEMVANTTGPPDGLWADWTAQPGYGTWEDGKLDDPDAWDKTDVQTTKDTKTNPAAAVVALKRGGLGIKVRCVVWNKATTTAKLVATAEAAATKLADKATKT